MGPRITTPIQSLCYTRADHQMGDATIPDGSRVLLSFGAASELIARVGDTTPEGPTTWSTHSSLRGPARLTAA
ncbi:hypothetical protein [Mycobacterium scrofulaceum]|uniref:Uncharacterized protein n=1 Tax=Mycobacterium scrofulaceum TaxID=1783 RepID=A0A1X0KIG1_MYCSC|nr:hypothetical protein BST44_09775 [Mycobacterium scrofulaceum]